MYKVLCDGKTLYDTRLDDQKRKLYDAKLELELNKTGSFTFTIYPDHPKYNELLKMKSIVEVYQDDDLIFRGRILDEEQWFYNQKQVTCEGELAFLLDSYIRPYASEQSPWKGTPKEYLTKLIDEHNRDMGNDEWKKFKVGNVTVEDGDTSNNDNIISRSDSDYKTTWELIAEKLVNSLGGYLWVRHEEDGNYIDYLSELDIPSNQMIEFGKNLLDLKKTIKGEEVMTGIIPLGEKKENSGFVTIATENNGKDYLLDEEAAKQVGRIFKTVQWDKVTTAKELKEKADEYLKQIGKFSTSIELTAADLAGIENVNPFKLGQKIGIRDKHHGLEELSEASDTEIIFLVKKLSIDILQPANNTLTVGATFSTFTDNANATSSSQKKTAETVSKIEKQASTFATLNDLNNYYTKSDTDNLLLNHYTKEEIDNITLNYYPKTEVDSLLTSLTNQINDLLLRVKELENKEEL